jgi:hypothetical protein
MNDFPNDEDGSVLNILAKQGLDMNASIEIEFAVYAPNEKCADLIATAMNKSGFEAEVDFDEGELDEGEEMTEENKEFWPSWSVYYVVSMIPSYDEIVAIQKNLDGIAKPLGGYSDGWVVNL